MKRLKAARRGTGVKSRRFICTDGDSSYLQRRMQQVLDRGITLSISALAAKRELLE